MTGFVIRSCCDFAPAGKTFLDAVSDGLAAATHGPPVALAEPPAPDWLAALHESGHAVLAHAVGRSIRSVSVVPPQCRFVSPTGDELAHVALAYAGPVGEMTEQRFYSAMREDDETDALVRVQAQCGGGCDSCQAARASWARAGPSADIEAARAVMRAGQRLAVDFISTNRAAVHALAARLMTEHHLDGDAVHSFLEDYTPFGSLRAAENTEKLC